jgi:hypothetical protein
MVPKQRLDPGLVEIPLRRQEGERARASDDVEKRQDLSISSQARPEVVKGNKGIRPRLQERHQGAGDAKSAIDQDEIDGRRQSRSPYRLRVLRPSRLRLVDQRMAPFPGRPDIDAMHSEPAGAQRFGGVGLVADAPYPGRLGINRVEGPDAVAQQQQGRSATAEFDRVLPSTARFPKESELVRFHAGRNARQCSPIRTEAGWPGSLKRFPVSVILLPSTLRIERSWSR